MAIHASRDHLAAHAKRDYLAARVMRDHLATHVIGDHLATHAMRRLLVCIVGTFWILIYYGEDLVSELTGIVWL